MAKRFVRSQNRAYKNLADKSAYVDSGSIIFNEDEKLITAWGKDYGLSEVNVTSSDNINSGVNNAVIQFNAGDSLIDTFTILGSNTSGKKINVTANSSSDSITLEHETIATELTDSTSTVSTIADGGTFDLYMPIEYNNGHVTKLEKKRYKIDYPNYGLVSTTSNGLAPKITNVSTDIINSQTTDFVLTSDNGTLKWMKLPVSAFKNDNTTYTFTGGTNQFTVTPSDGTAQTVTVTPSATITASGTGDSVITVTPTSGTNAVTYNVTHKSTDGYKHVPATGTTNDGKFLKAGSTAGSLSWSSISYNDLTNKPTIPTVNNGTLIIKAAGVSKGTFSANQSSNTTIDITASDLGLTQAMKYIGKTTTTLSDGATTNTITIGTSSVTAEQGNVVIDGSGKKEYIWNGTNWEEFGNEGNYKVIQTAVSDPTANGTSLNFIATISQDTNGVITPTKKTIPTAGSSLGVVKTTSTVTSTTGLTPSPIINGVVYYKDTDNNTAHTHGVGIGLTVEGTGGTSGTTTYKAKLKSETAHTASSATPTDTANRQYAVGVDKDGYLSVNVPWVNNTYTVNNGKLTMQIAGTEKTAFTANQSTAATFNVPSATASDYGVIKVSSVNTSTVTVNSESTTAGRYYSVELNSDGKAIVNVPWTDSNTDTKVKNTSSSSKVFILGQTTQNTAGEASTNASVYMQSGKLYSEGYEVINSDDWAWEVLE